MASIEHFPTETYNGMNVRKGSRADIRREPAERPVMTHSGHSWRSTPNIQRGSVLGGQSTLSDSGIKQKLNVEVDDLGVIVDGNPLVRAVDALEVLAAEAHGQEPVTVVGKPHVSPAIRAADDQPRRSWNNRPRTSARGASAAARLCG